jgi:hypothetical protein
MYYFSEKLRCKDYPENTKIVNLNFYNFFLQFSHYRLPIGNGNLGSVIGLQKIGNCANTGWEYKVWIFMNRSKSLARTFVGLKSAPMALYSCWVRAITATSKKTTRISSSYRNEENRTNRVVFLNLAPNSSDPFQTSHGIPKTLETGN